MTASRPRQTPPTTPFVAAGDAPVAPTPSRRARQLLQLAHQAVYRLPATYPGFAAEVHAHGDGWTVRGAVDVHCPHGAVFHLDPADPGHDRTGDLPSPATITTVTTMIVELVSWQFPRRFDELDGRYEAGFRPDLDEPGRRAVQLLGESRRTIRWLGDDGVVATAYRQAGTAHHIEVVERRPLDDGRWLPVRVLDVRRAEGVAERHHAHTNVFGDVEGIHLPLRRVATRTSPDDAGDGRTDVPVTIELRDHRHHARPPVTT